MMNAKAPRKGNKHIAQGIALSMLEGSVKRPERAKALPFPIGNIMLLPLQGDGCTYQLPRAMPWAMGLLAFQAAVQQYLNRPILLCRI